MRQLTRTILALLVIGLLAGVALAQEGSGGQDMPRLEGDPKFPAPEFPTGVDWLNVPAPLTMTQLRGKVVLLDFWTYGCINCIHMIPVLKQLEEKYGDALAVVGVHSAKFANEGQTDNIRQIVQRYGLEHPVINDSEFRVWNTFRQYGVNAWPTFVIIDPRGNLFAVQAGEIPFEAFDQVIGTLIGHFDSLGEMNRQPLTIALEGANVPPGALAFPGKVLADPSGARLFITDSSHNRLVIADLMTYEVLDVIGTGEAGFANGSFDQVTFDKPQGIALRGGTLYVADTNNHAIRAVDLIGRVVTTVAGTGEQGYNRSDAGTALTSALSSPWDVAFADDDTLFIAMAGTHQIWKLTLSDGIVTPLVGSGREGLSDGPLGSAMLAQPSGLFYRDGFLYFADSESSSIRAADIAGDNVFTLAGPLWNDLFSFGDVDGAAGDSRLQHALAVTGPADGALYVADTYNSKIKELDPATRTIKTLFGQGGQGGFRDGGAAEASFDEPGGLSYANGLLYVADTNNHAIRIIDLATNLVSTVMFPNPEALQIAGQVTVIGGNSAAGETVSLAEQTVTAGAGEIVLNIRLPEGYKLNTIAPLIAQWAAVGEAVSIEATNQTQSMVAPSMPLRVPVTLKDGSATLTGDLTIYYCEAVKESLCFIDRVTVLAPVTVNGTGAGSAIQIERTVTPPTT